MEPICDPAPGPQRKRKWYITCFDGEAEHVIFLADLPELGIEAVPHPLHKTEDYFERLEEQG
jgi:hypothetical protein